MDLSDHPKLTFLERLAAAEPAGLLILHHGRGANERDLLPVAELLDPQHRLHVVSPRAPLTLPGSPGAHWYRVPRVGHPDPDTFHASYAALAALHDRLWARTGIGPERTILGGFSMGTVLSYALGLGPGRPAPAGILAFAGFVPTVEGWTPSLSDRQGTHVFIAHGRADPMIVVEFARRAQVLLEAGGLPVEYHESDVGHQIDPGALRAAIPWVAARYAGAGDGVRAEIPR